MFCDLAKRIAPNRRGVEVHTGSGCFKGRFEFSVEWQKKELERDGGGGEMAKCKIVAGCS